MLKYVSPLYLATIFVLFCIYNVPDYIDSLRERPVAVNSVILIGVILLFLWVLIHLAGKRWVAEGRYIGVDEEVPAFPVQPLEEESR